MALHNNPYDESHFKAVERKAKEIQQYLENLVHEITKNASFSAGNTDGFKFKDHPRLNKLMDEITKKSHQDLIGIFNKQTKDSWERGSEKTIQTLFGKIGSKEIRKVIRNSREINLKALEAFQNRKVGNFKLSDSVWNITKTFRDEMESALDLSIASGKSAQKISQEVRHLLKYPDKHFKRVRDKHGNLIASKNAQKFKSGQGVYRSSYKNAMRLARTENNIAYHTATNDKYQEFDFVVGIEVRLSNNPAHCPFCESMTGKYPKDFKFTSWHPQCRCTTIPILKTPEEMQEDNDALAQGEDVSKGSKNEITETPKAFQDYIQKHGDKMSAMENPPYFYRDNLKYAKVQENKELFSELYDNFKDSKYSFEEFMNSFNRDELDEIKMNNIIGETPQKYAAELQGFNGKPTILSESEFNDLKGDNIVTLYRGLAENQQCEQFKYGDVFGGKGVYGDGSYTTTRKETAITFANGNDANIIELKIDLNRTKIVEFEKLNMEFMQTGMEELIMKGGSSMTELGAYATAKGYDAIMVDFNDEKYYVILNRTKLWTK